MGVRRRGRVGGARAGAILVLGMALVGVMPGPAGATVTAVKGAAYGYYLSVGLFGGPANIRGPAPTVALASDASNSPQFASVASANATVTPATFFSSGQVQVGTQGTIGPTGSVTTSTIIDNVNTSGDEVLTATQMASSCTASEGGLTAATTITNGVLQTDTGDDDPGNSIPDHPPVFVNLPANPAPNTAIDGHIHVNGATDFFQYIFNQHVINPDGSIAAYAGHQRLLGPTAVGDLFVGKSECGVTATSSGGDPPPADFTGDGRTDVSVFRPSNSFWFVNGGPSAQFGTTGDVPVPAYYDSDAPADFAVFRPSNGFWFVHGGAAAQFGASGDIPVPGDYDGDGDDGFAVFRPSNGFWYVHGGPAAPFGTSGDIPVPGDYDGDGDDEFAVFRPSTGFWFVNGGTVAPFGTTGDIPVPGDYDGDGDDEFAVFRPSTGFWFVRNGPAAQFGINGDIPVPGDYDGDGDIGFAVFRPSNGFWFVSGGPVTQFGASTDVPLPLPDAIRRFFFPPL